jgi:hypothetical protein
MKNRDKAMLREIATVLTEDIIKMIEDMERIQKANAKKADKARAKKREKAAAKAKKSHKAAKAEDGHVCHEGCRDIEEELMDEDRFDAPRYTLLMEQAFGPMSV